MGLKTKNLLFRKRYRQARAAVGTQHRGSFTPAHLRQPHQWPATLLTLGLIAMGDVSPACTSSPAASPSAQVRCAAPRRGSSRSAFPRRGKVSWRTRRMARYSRKVPALPFMLRRRYLAGFLFQGTAAAPAGGSACGKGVSQEARDYRLNLKAVQDSVNQL